ncbi:hypothetical protein TIFTF001_004071 [Ficus carica]|uniref:Uncharacterized protein n=1 Tax=Ficus carica TaxID=3494 RepID=A0AA87ZBM3_FICCA|nr:hypothetical protein TIFTF001_004071 [Ficus carica]
MTSGCFSSPYLLLRRKESSKRETAAESDYVAELETPARSSVSSQKSLVSMSSSDVEWAGFWVVLNGP